MENGAKRAAVLTALTSQNSREWTVGAGASRLTITLEQINNRVIRNSAVLSADVIIRNRSGLIVYYDRVNMPNPPTAIRENGQVVSRPLDALIESLKDSAKAVTRDFSTPRIEKLSDGSFRGDTLAVRSSTADGYVTDNDTTWASTQNGPGESTATTGNIDLVAWQVAFNNWILRQVFLDFDTSSLTASAIISAYVLTLYADGFGVGDADGVSMEYYYYDWGGTIGTDDFRDCSPATNITDLPLFAHLALSSWSDGAGDANNLTSDSAISSINKTGTTYMMGLFDIAYGGTPSGNNRMQFRSADESGTTSDPLFTVTYTLAKALPLRARAFTRSQLRR